MADEQAEAGGNAPTTTDSADSTLVSNHATANGHAEADDKANGEAGDAAQQPVENTFTITIKLPHEPYKTQTLDQAQDVRQSIIDSPQTFQYSCFHLEHDGQRIPDYVDLAEIPSIKPEVELTLVEDPYTEKDARLHFLRVRDLIGAAGDRTELSQGIHAGLSLHDDIYSRYEAAEAANGHVEGKDHPMAGYDFDSPASLETLLQAVQEPAPKPIKSIALSSWNPPPYHLRSKGHLLYIQVTTNEGEQHQITAHSTGFYINKSSNTKFDPFPRATPKSSSAHSLLTLLTRISSSFQDTFRDLQEHNSKREALSTFQPANAIPSSPWLVSSATSNLNSHLPDMARTQESYLISGADNAETLRDWNEEFQTLKELPKETVQDRVFRERAIAKLFADYNEAAIAGAVLIARGEVSPLNPTENRDAQIYVYNNVFYSYGADGVGTFTNEGGDEAARVATGKDVSGVRTVNQLDIDRLSSPGTVVIDLYGKRLVGQSIVPGIFRQREPGEQQIDYGGVEGKDVVAEKEVFKPLFEKLAKAMRSKAHPVWDKELKRHDLETSIETKGLLGTDGRNYALDLYRLTPLDVLWIEKHWKGLPNDTADGYVHRMTVLRPELIESFWRLKLREYIGKQLAEKSKKTAASSESADGKQEETNGETKTENQAPENVDISGFEFALNPDVFSGQQPQTDEEKEVWAKDEAEVRAACEYLQGEVIARLDGEVGFPMDGQSLTSLCHKRGINMRYLGNIAELSTESEPRLKALKVLALQEMVARAFKHVANKYLRFLPTVFAPACLSHLLNCLLGGGLNAHPTPIIDEDIKGLYTDVEFAFAKLDPVTLQAEVARQVQLRYRFELAADWVSEVKHIQLLREISLKLGLQLGHRTFPFTSEKGQETNGVNGTHEVPITNGHSTSKKKKKAILEAASPNSQLPNQTFLPDDIYNIVPVIKESSPRSVLSDEAMEAMRISIAQNQRELGQELLLESLSLHEQIYGVLHAEVARAYHTLSTMFYGLDDKAVAVELARKAVIVSERTIGIDSTETLLGYLNLGLFEHASGNSKLALTYFRHALSLTKIVYGNDHPDTVTTLNNAAVMLQNLKLFSDSRAWFEASLAICERFSGKQSAHTGTVLFQLAQALALDHEPKAAVNRMREAYNIFNTLLGPTDRNTKEAETWLEQLTQNAVNIAKHAKDVQARRMRRLQQMAPGARIVLQRQVGQTASEAASPATTAPTVNGHPAASRLDEQSIDELLKYIEGGDAAKSTPRRKAAHPKRRQQAKS